MTASAHPDAAALAARLARWRLVCEDRPLFRAAAGPRWLRLHLTGDERPCLLLTTIPGACLLARVTGPLPGALAAALRPERDHPLSSPLAGATLTGLGALPGERVACLRFARPGGATLHLLQQQFGSPGNLVLLDEGGRCLWAARRPPHALVAVVPPAAVYAAAGADSGADDAADDHGTDDHTGAALDHLAAVLAAELRARAAATLGRRLRAAEKLAGRREQDLAAAGTGDEHRRRAEALAAALHTVRAGQSCVEVADPRDGTPLVIDLEPTQSPAANLAALFHRARKAERGREVIAANLDRAREDAAALGAALAALAALPTADDEGLAALAAVQAWLPGRDDLAPDGGEPAGTRRRAGAGDEPARPFRRYLIDGRWEAWVGRSSRENDELTHGAAHGQDLWLHAQGAAGSHVILRTGGRPDLVPPSVLAKAAALAALHSKARHSTLAPVVWTEKRYVRKPRQSPPGTAVCLRDRTLMVEPGVAPGVEPA